MAKEQKPPHAPEPELNIVHSFEVSLEERARSPYWWIAEERRLYAAISPTFLEKGTLTLVATFTPTP